MNRTIIVTAILLLLGCSAEVEQASVAPAYVDLSTCSLYPMPMGECSKVELHCAVDIVSFSKPDGTVFECASADVDDCLEVCAE